jgi:hypothetical protein
MAMAWRWRRCSTAVPQGHNGVDQETLFMDRHRNVAEVEAQQEWSRISEASASICSWRRWCASLKSRWQRGEVGLGSGVHGGAQQGQGRIYITNDPFGR